MRFGTGFMLLALLPSLGWAGECEDDFSECQDLCSVQYGGSIRDEMKTKFVKCLSKCRGKAQTCRERTTETKSNHLNDGALDRSPSSRDVDEFGMPILKKAPPPEKPSSREELRDDDSPPPAKVTKLPKKAEPAPPPPEPVAKQKPKSVDDDDLSKPERAPVVVEKPAPRELEPAPAPVVKKKPPPDEPPPRVKPVEPAKKVDDDDLRNY